LAAATVLICSEAEGLGIGIRGPKITPMANAAASRMIISTIMKIFIRALPESRNQTQQLISNAPKLPERRYGDYVIGAQDIRE
jgi:hypothetical protein